METHRCNESIKSKILIHKGAPYEHLKKRGCLDEPWWMVRPDYNFDADTHFLQPICPIDYCPFCGIKLE